MLSTAMKLLEERHMTQELDILLWSDRMDLLAIANIRGDVSLQRLNWQRVWCLSPPNINVTVKGMAWRPDGKVIAIGYSNGNVRLVDVETKLIVYEELFGDPISCVVWISAPLENETDETVIQDDSTTFLPELPDLTWDNGPATGHLADENLVDGKTVNILLVGTASGILHISIFGLLECTVVNLNEIISENCSILSVHIAKNLSSIYAIVLCDVSQLTKVVVLETTILKTHSRELHTIAYKHGKIISLLTYLEGTIQSIVAAWEVILMEMDSKLASYASTVPEGGVAADFLDLLLFGLPSHELDLFLISDLTEKGLRKLGQSIELSYSNIQKLVLKHLSKVGQSISYHLAELRGLARMVHRYDVLGLRVNLVSSAISASGSFMVKGTEVQQVIDHSMRNYKAFFRWLYVVILRNCEEAVPSEISKMTQQDINFIGEFLQNFNTLPCGSKQAGRGTYFNLERLGQYLVDEDLTIPLDTTSNPWNSFVSSNPHIMNCDAITKHNSKRSLIQEHKHLKKSIDELFSAPKYKIGESLKLDKLFNLIGVSDSKDIRITLTNFKDTTLIAMLDVKDPEGFYFIELLAENKIINTKCGYFYFHPVDNLTDSISAFFTDNTKPLKLLDVQFYTVNVLSVLLEIENDSRTAVFGQFLADKARESLVHVAPRMSDLSTHEIPKINGCDIPALISLRPLEGCVAAKFAVSGSRKVSVVLMESLKRVCLYEMEADEEDEEEEIDITASTTKESDLSVHEIIENSVTD